MELNFKTKLKYPDVYICDNKDDLDSLSATIEWSLILDVKDDGIEFSDANISKIEVDAVDSDYEVVNIDASSFEIDKRFLDDSSGKGVNISECFIDLGNRYIELHNNN